MPIERSTKRRKIEATTATPGNQAAPDTSRATRGSAAAAAASPPVVNTTERRGSSANDVVPDEATLSGRKRRRVGSREVTVLPSDSADADAMDSGTPARMVSQAPTATATPAPEGSIRASGRKRRLPVKLQESQTPTSKQARARTRTPMANKDPKSQSSMESETGSKTTDKANTPQLGKENIIPQSSRSESPAEVILQAQRALAIYEQASTISSTAATLDGLDVPSPSWLKRRKPFIAQVQEAIQSEFDIHDEHGSLTGAALASIQRSLLAQVTGSVPSAPVDLEDEYQKVHEIVNQAVETGESNSMILIGSRGSGKTTLVNHVLEAQRTRYPDDFHTVRLNGFIHTDDKLALRDIWRQLGRDMEPEVNDDSIHSYADTLTMLLALLSDPEELGRSTITGHMAKSVIFVLDEFDLFATHPRQTLLYNLFDIAQSRKAPIAVLGLTTRVDIVEALEKRVRSRFSHRYVHFGLAKSLTAFKNICASFLELKGDSPLAQAWHEVVDAIQASQSYHQHVSKLYYRSKSVPDFLSTMILPLASLPADQIMATRSIVEHLTTSLTTSILGPDSKLDLLPSLSALELALLICGARQSAIYSTDNVTFNLVYEEYKNLAGKAKLQATASGAVGASGRVVGKDVAKNAWSDLIDIGFILEDGRGIGKVDIGLEEIAGSEVDLGQWSRWCKEI